MSGARPPHPNHCTLPEPTFLLGPLGLDLGLKLAGFGFGLGRLFESLPLKYLEPAWSRPHHLRLSIGSPIDDPSCKCRA